jgi:hypothetical protein
MDAVRLRKRDDLIVSDHVAVPDPEPVDRQARRFVHAGPTVVLAKANRTQHFPRAIKSEAPPLQACGPAKLLREEYAVTIACAIAAFVHEPAETKCQLVTVVIQHKRATALPALDNVIRLQLVEGFAHRPRTHPEFACQLDLIG